MNNLFIKSYLLYLITICNTEYIIEYIKDTDNRWFTYLFHEKAYQMYFKFKLQKS